MKSVETCNSDKFRFFLFLLDDNNFHCALLCCMIMLTQRKPLTSFDGLSPPLITATYYPPSNLANKRYYLEINSQYDRKICILHMFQNSSIFYFFYFWPEHHRPEGNPPPVCSFRRPEWLGPERRAISRSLMIIFLSIFCFFVVWSQYFDAVVLQVNCYGLFWIIN